MTKNELAKEVAVSEKLHLSTAVKAVDGILRVMKQALATGENITLRGFGTLSVVESPARKAVHFATKEPVTIPAHQTVKFRASADLKNLLNDGKAD